MKVINLNESQYRRLFEIDNTFESNDSTPQNLGGERYNMPDAVTTRIDGKESLVEPNGSDIEKGNGFDGSSRLGDDTAPNGPWQTCKNIGGF